MKLMMVAPSHSADTMPYWSWDLARRNAHKLHIELSEAPNLRVRGGAYRSADPQLRADDIHHAFEREDIDGVIAIRGGASGIEVLPYLDFAILRSRQKPFIGFSDFTSFNVWCATRGVTTFSGLTVGALAQADDFSLQSFERALTGQPQIVGCPQQYQDDPLLDTLEEIREQEPLEHPGYRVLNEGEACGPIIGENISTMMRVGCTIPLRGILARSVVFLENSGARPGSALMSDLSALCYAGLANAAALVFGTFQKQSKITDEMIAEWALRHKLSMPIVIGAPFGHILPRVTYPVGGHAQLTASAPNKVELIISKE